MKTALLIALLAQTPAELDRRLAKVEAEQRVPAIPVWAAVLVGVIGAGLGAGLAVPFVVGHCKARGC